MVWWEVREEPSPGSGGLAGGGGCGAALVLAVV